jgi:beta-xylosidase
VVLVCRRSSIRARLLADSPPRVGEDKTNGTSFINVNCYSSSNLVEWNYEGALLSQTASGDTGPNRVIERPKVIYNKSTKKYVMWMHIDSGDYKEAKIGVATGDSVCGKFTYLRSEQPLGHQSRDSGVFVDTDDKAYLLTEDVSPSLPHSRRSVR